MNTVRTAGGPRGDLAASVGPAVSWLWVALAGCSQRKKAEWRVSGGAGELSWEGQREGGGGGEMGAGGRAFPEREPGG